MHTAFSYSNDTCQKMFLWSADDHFELEGQNILPKKHKICNYSRFPLSGRTVLFAQPFHSVPIQASQLGYGFIFHCGADNGARWNIIQMRQSLPW